MVYAAPRKARFLDKRNRDHGFGLLVSAVTNRLGALTTLDISEAEPDLAQYLFVLDNASLAIEDAVTFESLYDFRWASGYQNGRTIRVQGVLRPQW